MKIEIRVLRPEDWEAIRAIYLQGIATGQATFETSAPAWDEWDAGHLACGRLGAIASGQSSLSGWAALTPASRRAVYAGVAEVSLYVAAPFRGQGVGRALLSALIAESEQNGIWTLQAGIFPENSASIALHKSLGFRIVGRREKIGKLKGIWRDTVLLERRSKQCGEQAQKPDQGTGTSSRS